MSVPAKKKIIGHYLVKTNSVVSLMHPLFFYFLAHDRVTKPKKINDGQSAKDSHVKKPINESNYILSL